MPADPVLVIDAGSSSIRCHLVGIDGCVTGSTSRPWTYVEDPTVSQLAREFRHPRLLELDLRSHSRVRDRAGENRRRCDYVPATVDRLPRLRRQRPLPLAPTPTSAPSSPESCSTTTTATCSTALPDTVPPL